MNFSLPIENPILIFSLILGVILLSPLLSKKLHIPSIVILILAGTALGPYGFNLLEHGYTLDMLGKIGLLYIMFLSGIEIDINDFKKNSRKSLIFGMFTFLTPMALGILSGVYMLHFSLITSILLSGMYASHTLMAYPIVSRYGIAKNQAVNVAIGGTIMAVTLSLLLLAGISGSYKGEINTWFWLRLAIGSVVFCFVVLWLFPRIAQYFFKHFSDSILQYVFVLLLVALSSYLAELAGLESILGAFLAGLALNKLIPNLSPLMSRINFVGNALFIPIFLIGVGMLVDVKVFGQGANALIVALVMVAVATASKWLAALFTQKTLGFSPNERGLLFGLSNAKASVSLATVMIGYSIILPDGSHLLNESVLNGTVIMILITCAISSFATEKAAKQIAISEKKDSNEQAQTNRMLIPLSNPDTCDSLMELAVLMSEKQRKVPIYALSVIQTATERDKAKNILERAAKIGAASDNRVKMLSEIDANISNGIEQVVSKKDITDIVIGLHHKSTGTDSFFGSIVEDLIKGTPKALYIYHHTQPINTIKRVIVAIPANAELESGFMGWFERVRQLSVQLGTKVCFYANESTTQVLKMLCTRKHKSLSAVSYNELNDWEDFLIIAKEIKENDLLLVISARKQTTSYNNLFDKLPYMLSKFFSRHSYLVIFPSQEGTQETAGIIFNTRNPNTAADYGFVNTIQTQLSKILKK